MIDKLVGQINSIRDITRRGYAIQVNFHVPGETERQQNYTVTVPPYLYANTPNYLELHTCAGLSGPWTGRILGGPDAQHPVTSVHFSLDQSMHGHFAGGYHTETIDDEKNVTKSYQEWSVPVFVNTTTSPPTMTFKGATEGGTIDLYGPDGTHIASTGGVTGPFHALRPPQAFALVSDKTCK